MSDIDVGEGWRRLMPGEVIQEGDQFPVDSELNTWRDTLIAGDMVHENDGVPYRRRHSPEVAASSDGLSALAARVEKIEARMSGAFTKNGIFRESETANGAANPAADAPGGEGDCLRDVHDSRTAAGGPRTERVTVRERTPGEKSAFWEGMNSRMVNDLIRKRDEALAECGRLRAELAEVKSAPAATAGGESEQEPVKYAVIVGGEMRNTVYDDFREARAKASEIACRGTPHFVGVVALYREPPRLIGWLTDEDRRAVAFAAKVFRGHTVVGPLKENADQLDALLDRRLAPKVVLKDFPPDAIGNLDPRYLSGWSQCMDQAKKAIQAAGVEVE